jgi:hypothetical protein
MNIKNEDAVDKKLHRGTDNKVMRLLGPCLKIAQIVLIV